MSGDVFIPLRLISVEELRQMIEEFEADPHPQMGLIEQFQVFEIRRRPIETYRPSPRIKTPSYTGLNTHWNKGRNR
jgi:hypothetical protein